MNDSSTLATADNSEAAHRCSPAQIVQCPVREAGLQQAPTYRRSSGPHADVVVADDFLRGASVLLRKCRAVFADLKQTRGQTSRLPVSQRLAFQPFAQDLARRIGQSLIGQGSDRTGKTIRVLALQA